MPGLKPDPLETATHAPLRRRVWRHPDLKSHSLLVLTLDQMHLAPLAGDPKPETVAAVENGANLDLLFGPLATVIDLNAVRRAKLDLHTNSLKLESVGYGAGTRWQTITFATPEAADACFTKVWRRLGNAFEVLPHHKDTWAVVRAPVLALAAVLLATAALALVLSVFDDFAAARAAGAASTPGLGNLGTRTTVPKSPLEALIGWMSWQAVCVVGGMLAAGTQVWLYRRLTAPPAALEIMRK